MGRPPSRPKIYHIVHIDRLPSIIADGHLWCDAEVARRGSPGTTIGMNSIKQRRLEELTLTSHPDLYVGDCVPFYFCPRSVMLYVLHRRTYSGLAYRGGQGSIAHLEADLGQSVAWADARNQQWAFTTSNAGSFYFEDFSDLAQLHEIDWDTVQSTDWAQQKENKQAEFLVEQSFPWHLITRIGIRSRSMYARVHNALAHALHRPTIEVRSEWYY